MLDAKSTWNLKFRAAQITAGQRPDIYKAIVYNISTMEPSAQFVILKMEVQSSFGDPRAWQQYSWAEIGYQVYYCAFSLS